MPRCLLLLSILHAAGFMPQAFCAGATGTIVCAGRNYKLVDRSYQQIVTIRLPGLRRSVISSTPRHHHQPVYSPGLRAIAFTSGGADTLEDELWVHEVKAARERLLFRSPDGSDMDLVGWSHDAASLYLVIQAKISKICRFDIPKRKLITLADGCRAAVAPDGLKLAFTTCESKEPDAYTVDSAGGNARALGKGIAISWSPDSARIALADNATRQLRVIEARTGALVTSTRLPESSDRWNYAMSTAWSPDGRSILVGSEAGSSTAHYEDYWLIDISGKSWKYLDGGNGARWSPAGDWIVYSTARGLAALGKGHVWVSHLVLLNVSTLARQPLTSGLSYNASPAWIASASSHKQ